MSASSSTLHTALHRLGATGRHRERRYQVPWLMMVGEPGSGRTSLAAGANLRRPYGSPTRREMEAGGWGVWLFDQGVVLDMPGMTEQPTEEWQGILQHLKRVRGQRPIDGLLLTVPATHLTGPKALDEVGLERMAQGLFKGLQSLRGELGVRVPVSVIITRSDVIPGFSSFCRTLPPDRREEMLGWSSPYSPQEPYSPAWVDEAFQVIHRELCGLQLELLADGRGKQPDRESAFLFPSELRALAGPVRRLFDVLFQSSVFIQPTLLRGLYFCGDPEAEGTTSPGAPPRSPAFVTHLLERKAFPESGLASLDVEAARARQRGATLLKGALAACVLLAALVLGVLWKGARGHEQPLPPAPPPVAVVEPPPEDPPPRKAAAARRRPAPRPPQPAVFDDAPPPQPSKAGEPSFDDAPPPPSSPSP
ncbi:type VI secretion system protein ImpL [Archangium gephyra]|uniref:IcmF-related protein n=1 Tax=Archangium gephyra TaxID=48 RepID=A0AAC8Q803_9BACT|nr:type VI secretion system protein [Archangium gephyra]AKJ02241.1 IcmF-related protein [Archangium gephyra]REG28828.1 type VI secretion system protein ImpL [Archangium gephyra]